MYSGLLIALVPLFIGYCIPLRNATTLQIVNKLLSWMVYLILFLMGVSLAFLDNLMSNMLFIFKYAVTLSFCILGMNALALFALEKRYPWKPTQKQKAPLSRLHMILESAKLCLIIFAGFLLGLLQWAWLKPLTQASTYALVLLLLIVGIQLRSSQVTLRQILINKRGIIIASVVVVSGLLGGILAAFILGLPLKSGLALASAFGWYSLSGIMITEAYGPVLGSAAFFNDLIREFVAILIIPGLMQRGRSIVLGVSGATSMDFTLPILQRSGGVDIVPPAVVHGFILSLIAPILMALFTS